MLTRRAFGLTALGAVLLAGCSDGDDQDDPGQAVDPGRPLQTMGEDGLPADFPREEVPIVAGEVTSVTEGGAKNPGYAVAVVVDGAPDTALTEAVGLLEDAGWTASAADDPAVQVLRRDQDLVVVTSAETSGRVLLSYAIELV